LRKELVEKKAFDQTLIDKFKNDFRKLIKDFAYKHNGYDIKEFGNLDELNPTKVAPPQPKQEKKEVHIVVTNKRAMKKEQKRLKKKK
jgi:hypothetical protein